MPKLTFTEKARLEKLFQMEGGGVLDLTNQAFGELVLDSAGRDIYDERYDYASGSKANRLRRFWQVEPEALSGRLILDLMEYARSRRSNHAGGPGLGRECLHIAQRLLKDQPAHPASASSSARASPAQPSSAQPSSAPHEAPSEPAPHDDPLARARRELVDELSKVAYDAEIARLVALRAAFPREHLPDFKTPMAFWSLVVDQISSGRGRLELLTGEAARQYPHNEKLCECHAVIGQSSPDPRSE